MNTGYHNTDALSEQRLAEVHPDLQAWVKRVAIEAAKEGIRIQIIEGLRTAERQAKLMKQGRSWTLNSRHLTGHAVDIGLYVDVDEDEDVELTWDWPYYHKFAPIAKRVAEEMGIDIEWGGDWKKPKTDGPHWQLSWKKYPK